MSIKKLYVVGNGFDLYHGIPSKYEDFRKYIENTEHGLAKKLETYFDYESLWSDFEQTLANFNGEYLIDTTSDFLVSYATDDWSDAYHHDYQYEINEVVFALSKTLKSTFIEWILQLRIPTEQDIKNKKLNFIDINEVFLTFNYTGTLQKSYLVPHCNVLHIHGKAENRNSNIMLGHAWKPINRNSLMSQEALESMDTRIIEGNILIDQYFKDTYKPTKEIISINRVFFSRLNLIDKIYVLGHKISSIDMPYFYELVKSINKQKTIWYISYLTVDDLENHKKAMKLLGIPEDLIIHSDIQGIAS